MKIIAAVATVLLFSQCHSAKMALQNGWQNKEEYKVSGRRNIFSKEKMSFGEYHTTGIKRSWIRTSGSRHFAIAKGNVTDYDYTNIISLDYIKRKQTLRFSMTDAANHISEVFAVSKFNAMDLTIGNHPGSIVNVAADILNGIGNKPDNKFYVQLYTKEGEKPWEMLIDNTETQLHPKSYIGYLSQTKDNYYTILPVHQMEGKHGEAANILFGSVGYELRNKDNIPVAAVSKLNKGLVYFQNVSTDEKFLLANACAALLMQDQIQN